LCQRGLGVGLHGIQNFYLLEFDFIKAIQVWKLESLDSFLSLLYPPTTDPGKRIDCYGTKPATMYLKVFEVKSFITLYKLESRACSPGKVFGGLRLCPE
jgi:hypothetical protein